MDKLFDLMNADSPDLRRGKLHSTNWSSTSAHTDFFEKMKDFFSNNEISWVSTKAAITRWMANNVKSIFNIKKKNWRRLILPGLLPEGCSRTQSKICSDAFEATVAPIQTPRVTICGRIKNSCS